MCAGHIVRDSYGGSAPHVLHKTDLRKKRCKQMLCVSDVYLSFPSQGSLKFLNINVSDLVDELDVPDGDESDTGFA